VYEVQQPHGVVNLRQRPISLHPLHVTPKPCRLHRHPDQHSRSQLAQFGLTPKSKRGLAASEAVDPLDALGQIGEESTD
jgi:hypothetical protein